MPFACPDCGARAVYSIIGGNARCKQRCGWQGQFAQARRVQP